MTEITSGNVEIHNNLLVYAILMIIAFIYLFIYSNFDLDGRLIKDFFIKKRRNNRRAD